MTDLQGIISELEKQSAAIETALAALRGVTGATPPKRRGRPPGSTTAGIKRRGRPAKQTESAATKQARLTDEGRKRLAESMRKRWAAKRAARKSTVRTPTTSAARRGARNIVAKKSRESEKPAASNSTSA